MSRDRTASSIRPRTVFTGDNLPVLRGHEPESVDMVYADPPFNSGRQWAAPIGSEAAGAAFRDSWHLDEVDKAWAGEIRGLNPALSAVIEAAGLARILHEGGVFGRLDVMGHFAAHIRDGDWPEMASEGAPEQLRRSRESVFEPWRRRRA